MSKIYNKSEVMTSDKHETSGDSSIPEICPDSAAPEAPVWPLRHYGDDDIEGCETWMMRYWLQAFAGLEVYCVISPRSWLRKVFTQYDGKPNAYCMYRPKMHSVVLWFAADYQVVVSNSRIHATIAHEFVHLVNAMLLYTDSSSDNEVESTAYTVESISEVVFRVYDALAATLTRVGQWSMGRIVDAPDPIISGDRTLLDDYVAGGYSVNTRAKYQRVIDVINSAESGTNPWC